MHRGVWSCCRPSIKSIEEKGGGSRPVATSRCPARYYRSDYDWYLGAAVSRKSGIRLRPRRRRLSTRGGRGVRAGRGERTQSGNLSQLRMPGEDSHMKSAVGRGTGDTREAFRVMLCETAYLGGRAQHFCKHHMRMVPLSSFCVDAWQFEDERWRPAAADAAPFSSSFLLALKHAPSRSHASNADTRRLREND